MQLYVELVKLFGLSDYRVGFGLQKSRCTFINVREFREHLQRACGLYICMWSVSRCFLSETSHATTLNPLCSDYTFLLLDSRLEINFYVPVGPAGGKSRGSGNEQRDSTFLDDIR